MKTEVLFGTLPEEFLPASAVEPLLARRLFFVAVIVCDSSVLHFEKTKLSEPTGIQSVRGN